ncbi:MAG: type II secretion system protein GspC [Halioglobus sp.]
MSAQWQQSSSDSLERASNAVLLAWQRLAQPEAARRVRLLVTVFLLVWVLMSLVELVWSFIPRPDTPVPAEVNILNPVEKGSIDIEAMPVDLDKMVSWNLFGVAGEATPADAVVPVVDTASEREGIENGARETRLSLKLRGVVAASQDGLGHAMIEFRSEQEVYAVGDKLPTAGNVSLAKVLPDGVVLDNAGTYEMLRLYDDTELMGQLSQGTPKPAPVPAVNQNPSAQVVPGAAGATLVAGSVRQQLYENPQSLAAVVRVSAVRENNVLKGYRVDPGKKGAQFAQLGFKAGDIVTSVNGIALDNPGNTMQLYQVMRTASSAVFDLERDGESLTLTVDLGEVSSDG